MFFLFFARAVGKVRIILLKKNTSCTITQSILKNLQKYKDSINLGNGISSEKGEPSWGLHSLDAFLGEKDRSGTPQSIVLGMKIKLGSILFQPPTSYVLIF